MREILFRGKRLDNGEWTYGFYYQRGNPFREDGQPIKHCIIDVTPFCFEVDPDTVGQYTGLLDKNGKGIFEGDIVLFPWDDGRLHSFAIVYESGEFLAKPEKEAGRVWAIRVSGYAKSFEVIGNIHDNTELFVQE